MDEEHKNIDVRDFLKHAPHEVVVRDVDPFAPEAPKGMIGWLMTHGVRNVIVARAVVGFVALLMLGAAAYVWFFLGRPAPLPPGADIQYPPGEPPRLRDVPLR